MAYHVNQRKLLTFETSAKFGSFSFSKAKSLQGATAMLNRVTDFERAAGNQSGRLSSPTWLICWKLPQIPNLDQ